MRTINQRLFALSLVTLFGLLGCTKAPNNTSAKTPDTPTTEETAVKDPNLPTYSVAMNIAYPPFEFIDGEGGFDGFDVELLNAVAEKGGFYVEYSPFDPSNFNRIIASVENGTNDMSASSIFITPERQETFNFSEPYFTMPIYMVGFKNPEMPQSVEDIENKVISVDEENFVLKSVLEESFFDKNNEALYMPTTFAAFEKMLHGEADLMIENIMTIDDYSDAIDGSQLSYLRLPDDYSIQLGYMTQKDNQELVAKLNKGLNVVQADGTYDKIYAKWFGELEDKVAQRTLSQVSE